MITDELRDGIDRLHDVVADAEDELYAIADRMDEEHMARDGWVKLPVDADGVPIHVGDELMFRDYRTPARASYVGLTCEGWVIEDDNLGHEHKPCDCRHVQPDSWQRIIADALMREDGSYCNSIDNYKKRLAELVKRCRRLAGAE